MSDVVVLDCPFCGALAVHGRWRTECRVCGAGIDNPSLSKADRLAAWNRRVVVGGKPEAAGT